MDKDRAVLEKPAYIVIKERIKEAILSGSVEGFLSESKIICQYQVSNTTARRVLNELQEEGLLERKVGKGSLVIPPSMKSTKELGIIFFDIFNPGQPFISEIIRGAEEEARSKNYFMHLYTTREQSISRDRHSSLYHLISRRKIGGFIILSPLSTADIMFLCEEKIPFVVVNNDYARLEIPAVIFNYSKAVEETCDRLAKQHFKRIGLVTGSRGATGIRRSREHAIEGYKAFLKKHSLDFEEKICMEKNDLEENGYEAMEEFNSMPLKERPDAVIFVSVMAARGALKYAEKNRNRPFVAPFTYREIEHPCYVLMPFNRMGRCAFKLWEQQLKGFAGKAEKKFLPLKVCFEKGGGMP